MKKLYDGGAFLIIGLIVAGAAAGIFGGKFLNQDGVPLTRASLYQAERSYELALTVADKYIDACIGDRATGLRPILPASCVPIATKVQAAVRSADAAYQVVITYENSPPRGVIAQFQAASQIVISITPTLIGG